MPNLHFTLPHWAYWVGLIAFPIFAMIISRKTRPETSSYSMPLSYLILVTGGIIGLHRLYLKNIWGLVFVPIFVFVLVANGQERDARSALSDATNSLRIAQRVLERETPRINSSESEIAELKADISGLEEGSFSLRSAERRLERAEDRLITSHERIETSKKEIVEAEPLVEAVTAKRKFWSNAARYAFLLIAVIMALDALLIPTLVRKANDSIDREEELRETRELRAAAKATAELENRKSDPEFVENRIDRLSLLAGEFVSYWAVIAVFVYYYEVVARYVFNSPTSWAHESMYLMFGMQYLIAGSYAVLTEGHVRVDIFYAPLKPTRKAWVDLATSVFFFIFAGTLLVTSYIFALDAVSVPSGNSAVSDWARGSLTFFQMLGQLTIGDWTDPNVRWGEISFNEWEVPLWPMKWIMVVGGLMLVLQGVSKISKDIRTIARGT